MIATQLFRRAKTKANELPTIIRTPALISTVMRAEIARFISEQEYDVMCGYDGDRAKAILKTANEANSLIDDYIRDEIL